MQQKEKLRIADAHAISMLKRSSLHRNVVDKRAVEAVEVGDHKLLAFFLDLRVTS
jgi:hypothetical protein